MTNYERIKAMSERDMADFLQGITECDCCPATLSYCSDGKCAKHLLHWLCLKSEVDK